MGKGITCKYLSDEENQMLLDAGFKYIGGCWCEGTPREEFKKDNVLIKIYPAYKYFKSTINLSVKRKIDELKDFLEEITSKA